MTNELAIRILTGSVLGTEEQTQEAVTMAVKALSMPSAQPKKGKWIDKGDDYVLRWECSECKKRYHYIFNYCPNCGAYMRTEDGEWA